MMCIGEPFSSEVHTGENIANRVKAALDELGLDASHVCGFVSGMSLSVLHRCFLLRVQTMAPMW